MSHNKIKVGGQSPNTNGEITVALDNLSDVSASSPSANQVLKYMTDSWVASSESPQATKEIGYSFRGPFTGSYSGGNTNYSLTDNKLKRFMWRYQGGTITQNGVNHLAIQRPSTGNWRNGFEFVNTGDYLVFMNLQHYGGGNAVWRFYDETNSVYFGSKFYMSRTGDKMPSLVQHITTTSANQQFSLRLLSVTTASGIGTPVEMRAVSINVYKL